MSTEPNYESEFCFLGEFVDEAPLAEGVKHSQWAVGEHPQVIVFEDSMTEAKGLREFRVVLKNGNVALIQGHSVGREPVSPNGKQPLLAIKLRIASSEICVAKFNGEDVAEIFVGEDRIDLKSA